MTRSCARFSQKLGMIPAMVFAGQIYNSTWHPVILDHNGIIPHGWLSLPSLARPICSVMALSFEPFFPVPCHLKTVFVTRACLRGQLTGKKKAFVQGGGIIKVNWSGPPLMVFFLLSGPLSLLPAFFLDVSIRYILTRHGLKLFWGRRF